MRTLKEILSNIKSPKTSLCEGLLVGMEETIKIGDTYKEKLDAIDIYIDKFNAELDAARKSNKRKYKNPFGGHTYHIETSKLLQYFDVLSAAKNKKSNYSYTGIIIHTEFSRARGTYSLTITLYDYINDVREAWSEVNLYLDILNTEEAMFDSLEKKVFKDAKTFVQFMEDNGINLKK